MKITKQFLLNEDYDDYENPHNLQYKFLSDVYNLSREKNGLNKFESNWEYLYKKSDMELPDSEGDTALMLSINSLCSDIAKFLVEKGADVNAVNKNKHTPLFLAVFSDDFDLVKFLVEKGADVNAKNKEGKTAWELSKNSQIGDDITEYLGKITNINKGD